MTTVSSRSVSAGKAGEPCALAQACNLFSHWASTVVGAAPFPQRARGQYRSAQVLPGGGERKYHRSRWAVISADGHRRGRGRFDPRVVPARIGRGVRTSTPAAVAGVGGPQSCVSSQLLPPRCWPCPTFPDRHGNRVIRWIEFSQILSASVTPWRNLPTVPDFSQLSPTPRRENRSNLAPRWD